MRNILFTIFLLVFTLSAPFPLFLQKSEKRYEVDALESLDILIEETENGISLLEAWSVARNGESFLEVKDEKVSNADLRAMIRITKLSTNHGIALAPLLRSYRSELLAKKDLKNLIGVEAGSAKATTLLLALLPLLLLLLAQMTGLDVVNTLRHSLAAQISLAFSITLQLFGRYWARRIINAIQ